MSKCGQPEDVVEQLENECPCCGEVFDAVEFARPRDWTPHGQVGAANICCDFKRHACFYHGLSEEKIEEFDLVPAADFDGGPEYDTTFESASERYKASQTGREPTGDAFSGWTEEEAACILRIDRRETEMLFGGGSPDSL